jgi:phage terminase large subunit
MKLKVEGSRVLKKNLLCDKKIIINRGGTRSTKSYSISQIAVMWLLTGRFGNIVDESGTFSIVRKWFPSLRATTIKDFIDILEASGYSSLVTHNKNEKEFRYGKRVVDYFSVDNETKIRGRKRNHLFIDEANELNKDEWQQLLFRTSGKIFLALNPSNPEHFIKKELEDYRSIKEKDVDIIVSSFYDNPYLDESIRKEIIMLKDTDPVLWSVYGAGEWGAIEGLIFQNFSLCDKVIGEVIGYGLDFGYTNDPTALIEVRKINGELFINTLIYERGLTNQDISKRLNELNIEKNKPIVADSAEPKSIEELYRDGWRNIEAAKKGKDSVLNSIDILRRYKINYQPNDAIAKELVTYKFKSDKNGNLLEQPIDFNNHAIDALRYYALNKLQINKKGIYRLR